MIALLWGLTSAASAQWVCGTDAMHDADVAIAGMDEAILEVDDLAFDRAGKLLQAAIACLDRPVTPQEAATLHKAMALGAFVNGQLKASRRSLAAARLLDPAWVIEGRLFPESHPYRDLYQSAKDPGPVESIGRISPKQWVVDGVVRDDAPTDRAFLLQAIDGGKVLWTGYLWSWDEIPDYGQATQRSVLDTPHTWWMSAAAVGGSLASQQQPTASALVWSDQRANGLIGGALATVRCTPVTVVGFEGQASVVGPSDPVAGGGILPSGQAVVLLGGAGWHRALQPHAAARMGASVSRFRAWPNGEGGAPRAELATLASLVVGLEVGVRSARQRVLATVDGHLARATVPHELRLRLDGGVIVAGPLAIEALVTYRATQLDAVDVDGSPIGSRSDRELGVGVAAALWF